MYLYWPDDKGDKDYYGTCKEHPLILLTVRQYQAIRGVGPITLRLYCPVCTPGHVTETL